MPENLYPQLPTVPSMCHESFNIEMVRKYYRDITNLQEKYIESNVDIGTLTIDTTCIHIG